MVCCDIDFNPVTYLYLNPELTEYGAIRTVEEALYHYQSNLASLSITYQSPSNQACACDGDFIDATGQVLTAEQVDQRTRLYSHIEVPENFNHNVYYIDAQASILNSSTISADIKDDLLATDIERLSVIHYMREGNLSNFLTSIDSSFNELLYRTFEKNTTLQTEEELYIDYMNKKKAGELVIGTYDDLMMEIIRNVDASYFGKVDLVWDGRAFFNNDVWFTKQVYFGSSNLNDSNFKVTFDGFTNFTKTATFDEICAKTIKVTCEDCSYNPIVETIIADRSNMINYSTGIAVPGATFASNANVFDTDTYFMGPVYFGNRVGGTCCGGDCDGNGSLIDLSQNVTFNSNINVVGDASMSNVTALNLSVLHDISCANLYADSITFRCVSNCLIDNSNIQNVIERSSEYFHIPDGLQIPGGYFTSNACVITTPIYFTNQATFCSGKMIQGCCEENGSNTYPVVPNPGVIDGADISGNITVDCIDASCATFSDDVTIRGDLTLQGDLILSCCGIPCMNPEYVPMIRNTMSNAETMIMYQEGMVTPGVILDVCCNIFTKPTIFTDVVVFGAGIRQEISCDHFEKDVVFDSNVFINGELHVSSLKVDQLNLSDFVFDLSQNIIFNSNVTIYGTLDVSNNVAMNSNLYVGGTLTAENLVVNNIMKVPVTPISPANTTDIINQLFTVYDNTGNLLSNDDAICSFDNGLIAPGALFAINGNYFSKVCYFANDVIFGGQIFREDVSIFSSNIEVINDLHVGNNTTIQNELVVKNKAVIQNLNVLSDASFSKTVYIKDRLTVDDTITSMGVLVDSDIRIKRAIRPIQDDYVTRLVKKARVTEFNLKRDDLDAQVTPITTYGLIAQEVESIDSRLVSKSKKFIPNVCKKVQIFQRKIVMAIRHELKDRARVLFLHQGSGAELHGEIKAVLTENSFELVSPLAFDDREEYILYGSYEEDLTSIDYNQITAMCLRSIQILTNRIEKLEEELLKIK